jgi:D-sedoheptulose 7-phosphate isomerase
MLTPPAPRSAQAVLVERALLHRNGISELFFATEAQRLADAGREMAKRFRRGGRLLAFGRGPYGTDAQQVAVAFTDPIMSRARSLPALDVSTMFGPWVGAMAGPDDIVMGFGPPEGDRYVWDALRVAGARGAMTFALPGIGTGATYEVPAATVDAFVHQELLRVLCQVLVDIVQQFLAGHGRASAAASIVQQAHDTTTLRMRVAQHRSDAIGEAIRAIGDRVAHGGKLILFGIGGSAADANDWAIDCVSPPPGLQPVPALSLAMDPATVTAIAGNIDVDAIFTRQLLTHARAGDVAVALAADAASPCVVAALAEARRRGLLAVALLGGDGGVIRQRGAVIADHIVVVESDNVPRVQEVHASIYHVMREGLYFY